MNKFTKQILGVVVVSVAIGFGITLILPNHPNPANSEIDSSTLHEVPAFAPTPSPSPVAIDQKSNLSAEIAKLTPEDFSNDYKSLKTTASSL